MTSKPKIFVSAYACEPGLGSEIGVGWHWVLEMSRHFELWVLTRKSNQHTIEPWIAEHPEYAGIHFLYFDLPQWAKWWKKGMRGVRVYYYLWILLSESMVRKTMEANGIDIYHYLTYGNALWPVSRYGSTRCFIWGPTSAGVSMPKSFTKHYSLSNRIKELIQRWAKITIGWNVPFRNRCRKANLILCKTDETMRLVPREYQRKCKQFTDVAVEVKDVDAYVRERSNQTIHTYFSAGTMVGWRNHDVLIEAFALLLQKRPNSKLIILGDGPERLRLERLISTLKIEAFVELGGQVDMQNYYQAMANSDVIVNSCFREGAVTVSFDSISFAKPLICFDTGGYTHYFKNEYSRVISGCQNRNEAVLRLYEAMYELSDKELARQLGEKAREHAEEFGWTEKGRLIKEAILECYEDWKK
mgnify:CR=1 FL=1